MSTAKRIALVGAGSMGSLHARVIAGSDRAELTRVIDPREEAGRALADRFGSRWTPEIGSLYDVDAVVLASATEAHHPLALEILGQSAFDNVHEAFLMPEQDMRLLLVPEMATLVLQSLRIPTSVF